jgi:hypothetical protein
MARRARAATGQSLLTRAGTAAAPAAARRQPARSACARVSKPKIGSRPGRSLGRQEEGPGRGQDDSGGRHGKSDPGAPAPGEQDERQGPEEVELLLDRQRPGVDEPAGPERLVPAERQEPVQAAGCDREDRRPFRAEVPPGRERQRRGSRHEGDERRQDAPRPSHVEVADRDGAGPPQLRAERAGDDEAADDEEEIHAERAARGDPMLDVEQDHRCDRDRPKPVQRGESPGTRVGGRESAGRWKRRRSGRIRHAVRPTRRSPATRAPGTTWSGRI